MPIKSLPTYDAPPVVETVLGVEFAPLAWQTQHIGMYWSEIRKAFPHVEAKAPLAHRIEQVDPFQAVQVSGPIVYDSPPPVRCWYLEKEDAGPLVQVQSDRFTYNWRKEAEPYPHYDETVRPAFEREWKRFQAFIAREGLGEINVLQVEVSYVNHIPRGEGWQTAADLPNVTTLWGVASGGFLPPPESVSFNCAFPIKDRGRLRVSLQPALRQSDQAVVLQLNITAKIRPAGDSVLSMLDLGREWVVRGFSEITSQKIQTLWGRKA